MKQRLLSLTLVFMLAITGIIPAFAVDEQSLGETQIIDGGADAISLFDEITSDDIQVVSVDEIPDDANVSYVEIIRSKTSVSQRIAAMDHEPEEVTMSKNYSGDWQQAVNSSERNEQTTTEFSSYGEQLADIAFCLDNGEYIYVGPAMKELYDNVRADVLKGEGSACLQDNTTEIRNLGVSYNISGVDSSYYRSIALDMGWLTYLCVDYDTPEMFYSNGYCSMGYGYSDTTVTTYIHPLFRAGFTSLDERIQLNTQMNEQVEQLVKESEQYPHVYERVKFFHDWLCQNNSYNNPAVASGSYSNDVSGAPWSCISGLLSYTGDIDGPVCEGYARAMEILCQRAGVNATVVTSESGNHMWNNLQYNQSWTGVDVTWDDGSGSSYTYNYFLKKVNNIDSNAHKMDDSDFVDYIKYPELSEISSTEIAHIYGEPIFQWSADKSSCAASFTCLGLDSTQTVSCTVSKTETIDQYVYTATCTFHNKTYTNTVQENKPLVIITQPNDYVGTVGEIATFTVSATGVGLTYQWQYCNSGSIYWADSKMAGNKTSALSVLITSARNGQKYRCMITDSSGNTVISNEAIVTANEAITITAQPSGYTGEIDTTASFAVKATGSNLTYQWQYCNAGSTYWANSGMTGNKTATLSVPITAARDGQKYRVVITDGSGNTVTSDAVTLTVKAAAIAITTQPSNYTGEVGTIATFTVKATGSGLTYQWQYQNVGTSFWQNSSQTGNKTSMLSVPITVARDGQKYRIVITDGSGNTVTSEAVTLTVKAAAITITTQPSDYTGEVGTTALFIVKATGNNLTYQWQYANVGQEDAWRASSQTGNKTATLSVPITAARDGQKYRVVITDGNGNTVTSNVVTLKTKTSVIAITTQPSDYTGRIGETATFTVEAIGEGLTYQWQYANAGQEDAWRASSQTGNKTATLSVPITAARDGQKYRVVITDGSGNTVTSNAVTLIAKATAITITTQPSDYTGEVGTTASFTVKSTGSNLTYQWQYQNVGTDFWQNSSQTGNKTATLSVPITAARDGQKYRCVITDVNGYKITSDSATLHVR